MGYIGQAPTDVPLTGSDLADNIIATAKIVANAVDETKLKDALAADFTEVVVTASDSILLGDATDSGNTKRDTVQGILDLVPVMTSMIKLTAPNGYGGTNTKIRRWTTTDSSTGSDITYADSASLGATFTINTAGVYAVSYSDCFNSSANWGLSLNTSQPTTVIYSITAADRLAISTSNAANHWDNLSWTGILAADDIIRCHTSAEASGANTPKSTITIARVG
mgnify:CR=1 FL=1